MPVVDFRFRTCYVKSPLQFLKFVYEVLVFLQEGLAVSVITGV